MPLRARQPVVVGLIVGILVAATAAVVAMVAVMLAQSPVHPAADGPSPTPSASPLPTATPASTARPTPQPVAGWFSAVDIDSPMAATWGTLAVDRDFDSHVDLFMGRHRSAPQLFSGDPTSLQLDPMAWPHPMDRHGCAWGEANGQGLPDLLCVQGAARGRGERPNELWIQRPNGQLRERAATYGVELPPQRKRSVNWLDFDRDGDLDLFIGSYLRRGAPDAVLRNDRGTFRRASVGLGVELNVINSAWADVDRDGWPDQLVVQSGAPTLLYRNHHGWFRREDTPALGKVAWLSAAWGDADGDGWADLALVRADRIRLLRNDHGRLRNWMTLDTRRTRAVAWADFNSDGLLDLYAVQGAPGFEPGPIADEPDALYFQDPGGGFVAWSLADTAGWEGAGESVVASDLDHDGRPDIVVANGNHRWSGLDHVLLNHMPSGNAVVFGLRGSRWNPLGFGARVAVRADGRTRSIWLTDGVAGSVQAAGQVHIGLGMARRARVVITWPDGSHDCLRGSPGDWGLIAIGSSPCSPD